MTQTDGTDEPANLTAGVTQLHFRLADAPPGAVRRRRLALRDGVRLEGNLHTLGYFAADICVGTPPKVFNLIVGARGNRRSLGSAQRPRC